MIPGIQFPEDELSRNKLFYDEFLALNYPGMNIKRQNINETDNWELIFKGVSTAMDGCLHSFAIL